LNSFGKPPDLSPIEHVWDEMERRLRHLPNQPVTSAEMSPALIRIWNNIPQAFFNNLVAMVTNQHFAVSDSHALFAQHVVERCPAEM
jgi:hypothetical protein